MSRAFINVYQSGDNIVHHYIEDGVAKSERVIFSPFLGIHSDKAEGRWTDIFGRKVKPLVFESIREMHTWKKQNAKLFEVLGDVSPLIQFLATRYPDEIEMPHDGLKIFTVDIEVYRERGFPKAEAAEDPVNAITVHDMYLDRYTVFATGEYVPKGDHVRFLGFADEESLLKGFVGFIDKERPHIITGWNVNTFDIHYLVNRIEKILGKSWMQKLSPEREVKKHSAFDDEGREHVEFSFKGTIIWDYMELYKKFINDPRESYAMDFICKFEIKEGKLEYDGRLSDLYKLDFEKFIDYNIHDCTLIKKLNDKLHLIEVAISIMHISRCVPDSVFGTVAPWDAIFYNFLLSKKKFCPAVKQNVKQDFPGGWVDLPIPGFYRWLAIEDIVSSYPCQIRSFNISPETILEDSQLPDELLDLRKRFGTVEKFLDLEALKEITPILKKHGVSFSANGAFFRTGVEGFIPEAYTILFNKRIALKKEMKRLKRAGDPSWKSFDISKHDIKILLNSGYGAKSNVW